MKAGRSNGSDSSLVYGIAVCVAILFGCLAMTAQAGKLLLHPHASSSDQSIVMNQRK